MSRESPLSQMQPTPLSPEAVLRGYFQAKDENRPHLLERVFAPEAELIIRNQSANIAFPAVTRGRSAIAEVLVRSFALSYENVYSFYLDRPPDANAQEFACSWLVGMSERASGDVRVGCGSYRWTLDAHTSNLAVRLVIAIEAMQVLPRGEFERVFAWLEALDYPWSSRAAALQGIPSIEELSPIAKFLGGNVAVA